MAASPGSKQHMTRMDLQLTQRTGQQSKSVVCEVKLVLTDALDASAEASQMELLPLRVRMVPSPSTSFTPAVTPLHEASGRFDLIVVSYEVEDSNHNGVFEPNSTLTVRESSYATWEAAHCPEMGHALSRSVTRTRCAGLTAAKTAGSSCLLDRKWVPA